MIDWHKWLMDKKKQIDKEKLIDIRWKTWNCINTKLLILKERLTKDISWQPKLVDRYQVVDVNEYLINKWCVFN